MLTTVSSYDPGFVISSDSGSAPTQCPFYLEFFGEAAPIVDTSYAEVIPAGTVISAGVPIERGSQTSELPQTANPAPIYEYWWTLGHPGDSSPTRERMLPRWDDHGTGWESWHEPGAHVYVFFPTTGNWRIKEVAANLQFLTPLQQGHQVWQTISDDLQLLNPLIQDVSSLASVPSPASHNLITSRT